MTWLAEMAWQLLFQLETGLGMVLCLASLAAAFAAMGRTLFNMYRSDFQQACQTPLLATIMGCDCQAKQ